MVVKSAEGVVVSPSENDKSAGRGWHDQFGNGLEPWIVEKTGPRTESFEEELISELHVLELLKALPEMQRLAIQKRLDGIPLSNAEQAALNRSRQAVRKWLGIGTKLRGAAPSGDTSPEHPRLDPSA